MWSTVDLREIRVFLTLAEELHFGHTAERLHLTSSRVSQIIRELERQLGGRLVDRTSRRVELTEFGERFRDEARGAYDELIAVVQRAQESNHHHVRPLHIGLFSGLAGGPHFPSIVRTFESRRPECPTELRDIPLGGSLRRLLESGEADLIATWLPDDASDLSDLVIGPCLVREPRVLAVGPGHPLASREAVSLEDIADHPVLEMEWMPVEIRDVLLPAKTPRGRAFSRQKIDFRDRGRLVSQMGYLIASGRIVHPTVPSLTKQFGHLDIVYVPITDMPPLRSALVWRSDNTDPAVLEFARIAEEVVGAERQAR
jgi:DNA-binding transcriptional LysR family regulator